MAHEVDPDLDSAYILGEAEDAWVFASTLHEGTTMCINGCVTASRFLA